MKSLAQQLIEKGLAPKDSLKKSKITERMIEGQHLKSSGFQRITSIVRSIDDLEKCQSVREFKEAAREIVLSDISSISAIVKKAHMLKDGDGGKRLIGMMYALREGLSRAPTSDHDRMIRQAFRKAGGVVNLPGNERKKKGKK